MYFKSFILVVWIFFEGIFSVKAQNISALQLDSLVRRAIHVFNVPGLAVAIVKDGKTLFTRGYGLSSIKTGTPVDENTLFGIASNSKAFTAAAIGILVDQGKLAWDDKLKKYISEFKMYDSFVTREFTIRDMLTHRSGLGLGAGDLMHNPDSSNFTIKDIIYSLRYIKPETSFRSHYAYDNIFYLLAAEVIARVSGMSWQDFIESYIMKPIQMNNSGASYKRVKNNPDIIDGYKEVDGKLITIVRSDAETDAGAGGIYSSAVDMSKWMLLQLNNGKYGNDTSKQLFSNTVHTVMWTPQIFIPVSKNGVYNTHFGAYGLGWFLTDIKGYENIFHTGQDDGMISEVSLIPDLNLGITVLSNQEGGAAVRAVIDQVIDSYIGISGIDRVEQWSKKINENSVSSDSVEQEVSQIVMGNSKNKNSPKNKRNYINTYHDNWFGNVQIFLKNDKLWFQSERSPQLRGEMIFFKENTFLVKWSNPEIKADAFVIFTMNSNGRANGFRMERASPKIAFSYDFQDLNFKYISR